MAALLAPRAGEDGGQVGGGPIPQKILKLMVADYIKNMDALEEDLYTYNEKRYGPMWGWDTSEITDMSKLFKYKKNFNEDISKWDTSNVTNMASMFQNAQSFNQDISKWDTSNVTNMVNMFNGATSFDQYISKWNIGNVKNMVNMFNGATSFNQDISNWKSPAARKAEPGSHKNMLKNTALSPENKCKIIRAWNLSLQTNTGIEDTVCV